ncbi:hypothetical protein ADUPG1_001658, partial [Aduncisulcus paluster]
TFKDTCAEAEPFLVRVTQLAHSSTQAVKTRAGAFISFGVLSLDHKLGKICKTSHRPDDLILENGKKTDSQQDQQSYQTESQPGYSPRLIAETR